jgi:hypothetical protein
LSAVTSDADDVYADDVYEIPASELAIPAEWQGAAVYPLETGARCPRCGKPIRTCACQQV